MTKQELLHELIWIRREVEHDHMAVLDDINKLITEVEQLEFQLK